MMPKWQMVLSIAGIIGGMITATFGAIYFFDRYFRTRRASERDERWTKLEGRVASLEGKLPNAQQLVEAEHRLGRIEGDVMMLKETQELREKIMANILHSGNPK